MKIVKCFLISLTLVSFAYAEQSVYADTEYVDVDSVAKQNSREIFILKQKISQLKEQLDGLKSIINGQADKIEQLKAKTNNNLEDIVNKLSQRVAALESKPAQVIVEKSSSPSISGSLTPTNNKVETNNNTTIKKEKIKTIKKSKSNKEVYKEAVLNFTNGKFSKAQEGFNYLKKRSYKSASINFYLGEIAFKKGKYKDAILNYQSSVSLNDKASYMDRLLLHTAIALKKKGKADEAKNFFNAVIMSYPNSASAKEAKKYLK